MDKNHTKGKLMTLYMTRVINKGQVDQPEGIDFPLAEIVNNAKLPNSAMSADRSICFRELVQEFEIRWSAHINGRAA